MAFAPILQRDQVPLVAGPSVATNITTDLIHQKPSHIFRCSMVERFQIDAMLDWAVKHFKKIGLTIPPPATAASLPSPSPPHMSRPNFLQLLVSGLAMRAIYTLTAKGLFIAHLATGRLNFAQGDSLVLAALLTLAMRTAGLRALRQMADQGLTVLLVEQLALISLGIADDAYALRQGRVVLSGKAADLRRDAAVVESYLS